MTTARLTLLTLALISTFGAITAKACEEHRRKPVECTSETSKVTGVTRTVCR